MSRVAYEAFDPLSDIEPILVIEDKAKNEFFAGVEIPQTITIEGFQKLWQKGIIQGYKSISFCGENILLGKFPWLRLYNYLYLHFTGGIDTKVLVLRQFPNMGIEFLPKSMAQLKKLAKPFFIRRVKLPR